MSLSKKAINSLRQYRFIVDSLFVSHEHCNKLATRRFLVLVAIIPIFPPFVLFFLTVLFYVTVSTCCFILFFLWPPPVGEIKEHWWVAKWLHELYCRPGMSVTFLLGPPSVKQQHSIYQHTLLIHR